MNVLVVDAGTSGIRVAVVGADLSVAFDAYEEVLASSPADGLAEFDAPQLADVVVALARRAQQAVGRVDGVAITNQRASTVVWDAATGEPIGPGLGWQDLRTIGLCFTAREHGLRFAPNQSATKAQWLLDTFDATRSRAVRVGTVDTWLVHALSDGRDHVTDASNAAITGLTEPGAKRWDDAALDALRIPRDALPTIVDSAGSLATAHALDGAPPIVAVLGDQQASLAGQVCVTRGAAKVTFGTGGMLDVHLGDEAPEPVDRRGPHGTFPIVAWRIDGHTTWGTEAIMLAAGTNVQWLRDDLGLIASSADSETVAAQCADTDGVVFVPAPMGLGTPAWDYGARSALLGVTRGTTRAHVVRAVLEGVAQRGADLLDAAERDTGVAIPVLRIDGGMSENPVFVQALADATQRPVEVAPVREATTRGAALFGLLALGHFSSTDDLAATWTPRVRFDPNGTLDRERWQRAVERSQRWMPDLSRVDF